VAMQRAIAEGKSAEVSLYDGLVATAMGEAAQRSITEGRVVAMSEILSPIDVARSDAQ
jgi:hypothetical protein